MFFQNLDVPNSPISLYQLSIRSPGQAFADINTYTFPLSPASLRTEPMALSSFSNTQGTPLQYGVSRIVDTYGMAPPVFTIEGTTGWDRHSTDGYLLTGLESMRLLQRFVLEYIELNQALIRAGTPNLYALEFYDYFMAQFWQIEPIGPQVIRQSNDKPFLSFYRFQWVGIRPVRESPYSDEDAIAQLLSTPTTAAIGGLASAIGATLTEYSLSGALNT